MMNNPAVRFLLLIFCFALLVAVAYKLGEFQAVHPEPSSPTVTVPAPAPTFTPMQLPTGGNP